MAFDSEDPREQSYFAWTVSLNPGEQKRLLLAQLLGRCFPEELTCILRQMTLGQDGFAVFQGRACGMHPGSQCLPLTWHPISYNANPTHSVWWPQVLQPCLPSEFLTSWETDWAWNCHTYQSYNIWEGVETLGFFGLTGESGNKKHPHRRFLSGKRERSLYSFSLPLTPRTFLPF